MTREEFIGQPDTYGSHRPLLWQALEATNGQVIEFGIGESSTPFLSAYCQSRNRELISYENNEEWFNAMKDRFPHKIDYVKNWDFVQLVNPSVLFIDHAPGERRKTDIYRFSGKARVIVVHDSEPGSDHGYQLSIIWKYFKYKFDDDRTGTWTTAISNFIDVTKWAV
jgi:hypothetical protein